MISIIHSNFEESITFEAVENGFSINYFAYYKQIISNIRSENVFHGVVRSDKFWNFKNFKT